ncbi:MAG: MBL fold metallo-hydrolase [Thermoproteota archaeon]
MKKKIESRPPLKAVDKVEIIILSDNNVDFLSTIEQKEVRQVRDWIRTRRSERWVKNNFRLPVAEHGFSLLIRVFSNQKNHTVLFDTGVSPKGVSSNAQKMGLALQEVESIVLSHGHYDHFGGLVDIVKVIGRKNLPIIVHEDMFQTRGVAKSEGRIRRYPSFPSEGEVDPAIYVETKRPHLLAEKGLLVTGEIPRKTDFEEGYPNQRALSHGEWKPDPWVWDERAVVLNVKNKGLVVISGCAHAGIVNTTLHAQELTQVEKIHAVMGGFHLSGKGSESKINRTVSMMKKFDPDIVVPTHCTGWKGKYAFFKAMPQAFVWNSVGHLYTF